jgi:hypothetical protein
VTRSFTGVFEGTAAAAVEGFAGSEEVEITEKDEYTRDFTLDTTTPRADFRLVMDEKTGNLFTDCAVNILDENGKALRTSAFNGLEADLGFSLPAGEDEATYTLQVVGAFALAEDMADWGFALEEKFSLAQPVAGTVKRAGGGDLRLFCGVPTDVELIFADAWPAPPNGMKVFGTLRFHDEKTTARRPGARGGRPVLEVPILLD